VRVEEKQPAPKVPPTTDDVEGAPAAARRPRGGRSRSRRGGARSAKSRATKAARTRKSVTAGGSAASGTVARGGAPPPPCRARQSDGGCWQRQLHQRGRDGGRSA
jgi:hypothetical protein